MWDQVRKFFRHKLALISLPIGALISWFSVHPESFKEFCNLINLLCGKCE